GGADGCGFRHRQQRRRWLCGRDRAVHSRRRSFERSGEESASRRPRVTGLAREASKISLVLADVDGTLVTAEKVLTARAVAAVQALHTAGIGFAITSGRPPRGMAVVIDSLALQPPVAGFNGGIFVKPDMTIMEEHVLATAAATRAHDIILQHKMDVWVYSGKNWFIRDADAPHVS